MARVIHSSLERVQRYDEAYEAASAGGYALRARMLAVLAHAGPGPGAALDAGMGPGRLCAELAAMGWTVSGVDASPEMVTAARTRMPEAAERLVVGRIESLPFASESFDLVTATGVLEYAGPPAALPELARVVRPGGRVIVSYPNPLALYCIWKTRLFYPLVRTTKRLLGMPPPEIPDGAGPALAAPAVLAQLEAAGLSVEQTVFTSYLILPSPLAEAFPRVAAPRPRRVRSFDSPTVAQRLATQVVYASRRP